MQIPQQVIYLLLSHKYLITDKVKRNSAIPGASVQRAQDYESQQRPGLPRDDVSPVYEGQERIGTRGQRPMHYAWGCQRGRGSDHPPAAPKQP